MPVSRVECEIGGRKLSLETGKLAKQATGAIVAQFADTVILTTVVAGSSDPSRDFFPMTIEYRERHFAAGKFPGGYVKREGKPTIKEVLTCRLMDRPLRPLFPPEYTNELQIISSVMSADKDIDPDVFAIISASAALHISPIPLLKPIGAVRIGRVGGEFICLPTLTQMEESDLDLIVCSTRDDIVMIEGFARELNEETMTQAILLAHAENQKIIHLIESLRLEMGIGPKPEYPTAPANPLVDELYAKYATEFRERKSTVAKLERQMKVKELKDRIIAEYTTIPPGESAAKADEATVRDAIGKLEERVFRDITLSGKRIDGRGYKEIRPITCEVDLLPRTHGSALFQRGETQALVITTLGTAGDEQKVEGLVEEYSKKFMLDYNFPPFSVGEVKRIGSPGRREIGHGMLAERSLKAVIPPPHKFPYTIRLVSDILESNGSSSMATVCGGTLSLMDAGVPIKDPVAGISIGLIKEPNGFTLLTDIQGDEDHYGDMDFKVAGTQRGITGIQLDMKVDGINEPIIRGALEQAREARREILKQMLLALRQPRGAISELAPRLLQVKINPEKIGLLIGPGGKTIKGIQEATGAKLDIDDDGTVSISHYDALGAEEAKRRVEALTEEVKVGKIYDGRITSIKEFGAFVEILPGRDGLCHISELDDKYISRVEDVVKVGDRIQVKVIAIDEQDRVKLSRRVLIREAAGLSAADAASPIGSGTDRGDRNRGDRGDRGRGDRGDRSGRDRR